MSSKQASRALVTLFCPSYPIFSPITNTTPILKADTKSSSSSIFNPSSLSSPHSVSRFPSPSKSDLKTPIKADNASKRARSLPSIISPPSPIKQPQQQSQVPHIDTMMSAEYLIEEYSRPWTFNYYHKSGALKDTFTTYLHFTPDGFIRGRGMDSIGLFYLAGRADVDIGGWTWYFHKTYVSQDVADQPESAYALKVEEEKAISSSIIMTPSHTNTLHTPSHSKAQEKSQDFTADTHTATTTAAATAVGATIGDLHVSDVSSDGLDETSSWGWGLIGWMERAHVEYLYEGRARTHVSHTGYWTQGAHTSEGRSVGVSTSTSTSSTEKEKGHTKSSPGQSNPATTTPTATGTAFTTTTKVSQDVGSSPRGAALWGVWETSSHGSHFELQKGGVFFAFPT